jgi:hypothetical protein
MPSFQPYVQRAGDGPTTINTPAGLPGGLGERLEGDKPEVSRDVKMRRYQRWFFYVVIVGLFLGALGLILKVYSDNTGLTTSVESLSTQVKQRDKNLEEVRAELAARNQAAETANTNLEQMKKQLEQNMKDLEEAVNKSRATESSLATTTDAIAQDQLTLERAKANTLNLILNLGAQLSNKDISRIKMADISVAGADTDKDGLPDDLEAAIGTDPLKADTDGDNYSDREEAVGGFNPLGKGLWPIDNKFAANYKGRVILNKQGEVWYAWYVSQDSQRYYMGNSADKFEALRQNDFWTKQK